MNHVTKLTDKMIFLNHRLNSITQSETLGNLCTAYSVADEKYHDNNKYVVIHTCKITFKNTFIYINEDILESPCGQSTLKQKN